MKNKYAGSNFDDFLKEELEAEAKAAKRKLSADEIAQLAEQGRDVTSHFDFRNAKVKGPTRKRRVERRAEAKKD